MPISRLPNASALLIAAAVLGALPATASAQDTTTDSAARDELVDMRNACRHRDFSTFLQYYIGSAAVRQQQTAPQVEQRRFAEPQKPGHRVAASQFPPFGIGQIDWDYADPASLERWEANPAHKYQLLDVTITELPGGGRKVVYQPGIFRDDGEGDSKTLVRRTGTPAAYVFGWQNDCWQLTQDLR